MEAQDRKRIFLPKTYIVEIGGRDVELKPLPSGKARELFNKIKNLRSWLDEEGKNVGDMTTLEAISYLVEKAMEQPYEILKHIIPDLKPEELDAESIPKIIWIIELVVEQNGFEWALDMLKNWFRQLESQIPFLLQQLVAMVPEAGQLMSSTSSPSDSVGNTDSVPDTLPKNSRSRKSSTSSTKAKQESA